MINQIPFNWIIIIIILISGGICLQSENFPRFFGFRNPTTAEKTFTHYIDPYDRKKHKYPFYGYSLYGFDDNYYYPRLNSYLTNNSPVINPYQFKNDNASTSYFNQTTVPLRYSGHTKNLGGIDYTGLPSSFHVRQRTN